MADVVIKLVVNKQTGKKDVVISYTSDPGAIPMEHEDEHRAIVDKLLDGGALKAGEIGEVVVLREQPKNATENEASETSVAERRAVPTKE